MLVYSSDLAKAYTRFNIPYADLRSYMNPEVNLTKAQMYDYAHRNVLFQKINSMMFPVKVNLIENCTKQISTTFR